MGEGSSATRGRWRWLSVIFQGKPGRWGDTVPFVRERCVNRRYQVTSSNFRAPTIFRLTSRYIYSVGLIFFSRGCCENSLFLFAYDGWFGKSSYILSRMNEFGVMKRPRNIFVFFLSVILALYVTVYFCRVINVHSNA